MSTRFVALLLVVAVGLAPAATALQQASADAELKEGIRQAQLGDFEKAVVTLDAAARRLAAEGGRSRDLARAYVYLSIAYLGLSQEQKAKAQFLEALKADTDMQFDEGEFPPKVLEFFESAREEAVAEGVVPRAPPPSAETPEPATSTAAAEPEEKGGGSKKLLLIGGGVAAVAVIAAAAGGGGDGGSPPCRTSKRYRPSRWTSQRASPIWGRRSRSSTSLRLERSSRRRSSSASCTLAAST